MSPGEWAIKNECVKVESIDLDKTMDYCQDSVGFVIEEARTVRKVVEEAKLTSIAASANPYDYFTKIIRNCFYLTRLKCENFVSKNVAKETNWV